MALIEQADLALDLDFQKRVEMAVLTASKDVAAELGDMSDEKYARRQSLAITSLINGVNVLQWSKLVASNPVITEDSPDDAIQFTVNSLWNSVSGASSVTQSKLKA